MDPTENTHNADERRADIRGDEHRSSTERQLRCLVVPEPATYDPSTRLDVVHDPDLNLLWGAQE